MRSSPAVILRDALPEDLPELRQIAAASLIWDPDAPELVDLLWPREQPEFALVVQFGGNPVGFALGSLGPVPLDPQTQRRGHINLLAVVPKARRRSHGTTLLTAMEARLTQAGAQSVFLGGTSPVFAWPGIDARYTAAVCLAEAHGYVQHHLAKNMTVELTNPAVVERLSTEAEEKLLAERGITVRLLREEDRELIEPWLATWRGTWREETLATLNRPEAGCYIAVQDEGTRAAKYIGFACYGVNRAEWFGPMGTSSELRKLGIGSVLLRRSLDDLRRAGHETAQICWVGPYSFYARTVDAYFERLFWIYRRDR